MGAAQSDAGHWSDCAVNSEPAYPAGPCDCGGLDLAAYDRYMAVVALIPSPGSLAQFVRDGESPRVIEAEQSELGDESGLGAVTLPSSQDRVSVFRSANCVNLDQSGVAVIGNREALSGPQGVAGNIPPHSHSRIVAPQEWHDSAIVPNVPIVPVR
jgi:hypothetical protein